MYYLNPRLLDEYTEENTISIEVVFPSAYSWNNLGLREYILWYLLQFANVTFLCRLVWNLYNSSKIPLIPNLKVIYLTAI